MNVSIQRGAGRLMVSGSMTLETAAKLLTSGLAELGAGEFLFDLEAVTDADSAGLAVLFGWQRAAQAHGKQLRVANIPASLVSLAEVYGVTDLLPSS
jgi:phospholipid transport system transporter-binding protein